MQEGNKAKQNFSDSWPSPQDYNEAVQNPRLCFADEDLASSTVELNHLGLPKPNTGMFASVYRMRRAECDWALRCFLHSISEQQERFSFVQDYLNSLNSDYFVEFSLLQNGIRIGNRWYPVQKMQWCKGETLELWLSKNLFNRESLERFLVDWRNMLLSFRESGIAHGDLQHGNILMSNGCLKVVDYDGMFVPELKYKKSTELGHPNYQHPQRASEHFGLYLDNFSAWVIHTSVELLTLDPGLWMQLKGGEDCLLFRKSDFADPLNSSTFMLLENHVNPDVRDAARTLRYLSTLKLKLVPSLEKRPEIPHTFSELGALKTRLPKWFDDEDLAEASAASVSIAGENPLAEPDLSLDQGPASFSRKRKRSRSKGGSSTVRRFAEPVEPEEPELPIEISPLAQLARKVQAAKAAEPGAGKISPAKVAVEISSSASLSGIEEREESLGSRESEPELEEIDDTRTKLATRLAVCLLVVLMAVLLYLAARFLLPVLI